MVEASASPTFILSSLTSSKPASRCHWWGSSKVLAIRANANKFSRVSTGILCTDMGCPSPPDLQTRTVARATQEFHSSTCTQ
eukprot:3976395-Amphidinium_carterae.1